MRNDEASERSRSNVGLAFLAGGGDMGARMRAFDWTSTPLGPPERWPHGLKTAVRIMLTSRQPFWIGWGEALIYLYNDPYKSIIGGKHPHMLGQPTSVVWREIWDVISPMLSTAMQGDEGTYVESQLLIMERHGYREETYYTFSYSPVPNDDGSVGGIICANTDDTQRVIAERQLALLRELAAKTANSRSWQEACARSGVTLASNLHDLPFALIYALEPGAEDLVLAAASGLGPGHPAAPRVAPRAQPTPWPFTAVVGSREIVVVEDLAAVVDAPLPSGVWEVPPASAALVPIAATGQTGRGGVLVVGLNPFRLFDHGYRDFLSHLAAEISASIASAQAFEEERRRAEALAEIDRAKTLFFTNVSHELRTPLTLMLGPLEDMLEKPESEVSPDNRELIELVHRHGLRLLKLVNTLLDFSRIEAGRMQAVFDPTDLAELTSDLASTFRAAVDKAGLQLVVDCPPLAEPVYVDRDLWEKVVLNLISNAFKFTFEGEIGVRVQPLHDAVELTIWDTGVGIPEAELPHVFERFHRVEGTRRRSHEGTGIGLALVKEVVKLHGGSVDVESTEGEGTRFTIVIPVGFGHLPQDQIGGARMPSSTSLTSRLFTEVAVGWLGAAERATAQLEQPNDAGQACTPPREGEAPRPRIVLADDNADLREYVRRLLRRRFDVDAVADGKAALAAMRRRRPDLLLSDIMMPELDGFGLLEQVRADPELRNVPVIMLSARAGEEARIEGVEAGADDYLVKPFSARELLARVTTHVEMARVRRRAIEALHTADRRKDEFLATLAHELRNPLAPIRNSVQIMRLAAGDVEVIEKARQTVERQLDQLVRLVDDLLDVSRITRNKVEIRKQRVSVQEIVHSAVETSRPLFDEFGCQLSVALPEPAIWLHADLTRMAQVVANLLNNAAKYTPAEGHVWLSVETEGAVAVIEVRDDGIGISAELLPYVFDMFAQAGTSRDRAHGGLGIGLTLVKSLVELHDGTVEARSAGRGKGSELVVRLPLADSQSRPAPDAGGREADRWQAIPRRRILVVDDNRDSAVSLGMLLEMMGHEVRIAHDGPAGLEQASGFKPELVLLDIGMPGMSGYEVAQRIREQPELEATVLVAVTGWGQDEDRRRSRQAGFDHHLTKPVNIAAMEPVLESLSPPCRTPG